MILLSLLGLLGALEPMEGPVSAEAAVLRGQLSAITVQTARPAARQALLETPVARVNGETISMGMVLFRYEHFLDQLEQTSTPVDFAKGVHQIVERDLGRYIEVLLLRQAAEKHWSPEQLALLSRWSEQRWTEEMLPRMALEFADRSVTTIETHLIDDLRGEFLHVELAQEYLRLRAQEGESMRDVVRELRAKAQIQTAYELANSLWVSELK